MNWQFQGIMTLRSGERLKFRTDHGYGNEIWAWRIHDPDPSFRRQLFKFERVPKGALVELYDLEAPPATVSYIP